jgi:5-deoxy-glucuronate isomerase
MSKLIVKPGPDGSIRLAPPDAGWNYIGFEVHRLAAGERADVDLREREVAIVPLSGTADVVASSGATWDGVGGRRDVFEAPPDALYLPPGGDATVRATAASQIAFCFAQSDAAGKPRRIDAAAIDIETRGAGNATRHIRHVIPPAFPAHRLLVVEVLTPSGNWSSYPPHKHDVEAPPGEVALEEIYYHRQHPSDGFAFQRVYTDDRSLNETMTVQDGDVVLVPRGYHVVAQAYGYQGYYLNILAGDRRSMAASDDRPYRWIRDEWQREGGGP